MGKCDATGAALTLPALNQTQNIASPEHLLPLKISDKKAEIIFSAKLQNGSVCDAK